MYPMIFNPLYFDTSMYIAWGWVQNALIRGETWHNFVRHQAYISMVSCQKGPTRHAYALQIGPFWQDTLDIWPILTVIELPAYRRFVLDTTNLVAIAGAIRMRLEIYSVWHVYYNFKIYRAYCSGIDNNVSKCPCICSLRRHTMSSLPHINLYCK